MSLCFHFHIHNSPKVNQGHITIIILINVRDFYLAWNDSELKRPPITGDH